MDEKVYRYDFNGAEVTSSDLIDAFCNAFKEGCTYLILENVRSPVGLVSFILSPSGIATGPVISLLEEVKKGD